MSGIIWFDIIIIAFVLILGIKGVINGFVREIFGLLGLIGGIVVASRYAEFSGNLISQNVYLIADDSGRFFAGFLVTLLVVWIVCILLGKIFAKLINLSGLGFIDRILGFLVGSGKVFLVISVLVAIVSNIEILNNKIKPYFSDSKVYPILLQTGAYIMNMDIKSSFESAKDKVDDVAKMVIQSKEIEEIPNLDNNQSLENNTTKE